MSDEELILRRDGHEPLSTALSNQVANVQKQHEL